MAPRLFGRREAVVSEAVHQEVVHRAAAAENQLEVIGEALTANLELALEDEGWQRLLTMGQTEFTREGLQRIADLSRVVALSNPLVKRGCNIRQSYVWGAGVSISARATGENGEQDVNTVVQQFLDDEGNLETWTGLQAREEIERSLATDGTTFHAHITNPRTGRVQVRDIPFDEVQDIVCNPDDASAPWYYVREWEQTAVRLNGTSQTTRYRVAYPDLGYWPANRPKAIDGVPIRWDAPVLRIKVNGLRGWRYGVGDVYAALAWARAYKDFLGDWATLVKALSKYAWRATSKGSKAQAARTALGATPTTDTGIERPVGATALMPTDQTLEAIPKTGATIDSDSGRPLAAMVSAALDLPVTWVLGDPGVSGARAVAETLDEPTANAIKMRRAVHTAAIRKSLGYVVAQAIKAPQGPLRGSVTRDPVTKAEVVVFTDATSATVDIVWPDLSKTPLDVLIKAIAAADQTEKIPPLVIVRLLLEALGVDDVDEVIADMTDDQGNFKDPAITAALAAQRAADRGE